MWFRQQVNETLISVPTLTYKVREKYKEVERHVFRVVQVKQTADVSSSPQHQADCAFSSSNTSAPETEIISLVQLKVSGWNQRKKNLFRENLPFKVQ